MRFTEREKANRGDQKRREKIDPYNIYMIAREMNDVSHCYVGLLRHYRNDGLCEWPGKIQKSGVRMKAQSSKTATRDVWRNKR